MRLGSITEQTFSVCLLACFKNGMTSFEMNPRIKDADFSFSLLLLLFLLAHVWDCTQTWLVCSMTIFSLCGWLKRKTTTRKSISSSSVWNCHYVKVNPNPKQLYFDLWWRNTYFEPPEVVLPAAPTSSSLRDLWPCVIYFSSLFLILPLLSISDDYRVR